MIGDLRLEEMVVDDLEIHSPPSERLLYESITEMLEKQADILADVAEWLVQASVAAGKIFGN
jgi:hypothetical protein